MQVRRRGSCGPLASRSKLVNCGSVFRRFQGSWFSYGGRVVRRRGDGGRYCALEAGPAGLSGVEEAVPGSRDGGRYCALEVGPGRCQSSREVAPGSRDGGRYCVLEVSPGQLSAVAGGCAGVGGRWSVLRFGGESGTSVGHGGKLCGRRGDGGWYCVSGAGSGRLSGIAASDAGSGRRRLVLRFEVGTGARGETLDRASCLTGVCCWHG